MTSDGLSAPRRGAAARKRRTTDASRDVQRDLFVIGRSFHGSRIGMRMIL
jgi:hypothetical protein